jgi:hypothetical protein
MLWAITFCARIFDQKMDVVGGHPVIERRHTQAFLASKTLTP